LPIADRMDPGPEAGTRHPKRSARRSDPPAGSQRDYCSSGSG